MVELRVERKWPREYYTIGRLYVNGAFFCNTLEDTELALNVQHRQLLYNLRSAVEKYEIQKQNVAVAQRVFDNIAKKYEFGVASSLDVTNAGTNLVTAQNSYVQALLDIVNAQGAETTLEQRRHFAERAFGVSSHYDTAIHAWFEK